MFFCAGNVVGPGNKGQRGDEGRRDQDDQEDAGDITSPPPPNAFRAGPTGSDKDALAFEISLFILPLRAIRNPLIFIPIGMTVGRPVAVWTVPEDTADLPERRFTPFMLYILSLRNMLLYTE